MRIAAFGGAWGDERMTAQGKDLRIYIGTYTSEQSRGIYLGNFNTSTGSLDIVGPVADEENPSYLTFHPTRPVLYAVNELVGSPDKPAGRVVAYAIDETSGSLEILNRRFTEGDAPCYLHVDRTGSYLMVANYVRGSATLFELKPDGALGVLHSFVQYQGRGGHPTRQTEPHAHAITTDPSNRWVFVTDLGLDRVYVYRVDEGLGPAPHQTVELEAGAGPRHIAFHPGSPWVYVMNELDSTVTVLRQDVERGILTKVSSVSVLPAEFQGENTGADIHVHPSGRFLYTSNRGHDSIAAFRVDDVSGTLDLVHHTPTGGMTPRNFALDPSGRFMLVANQESDSIVVFAIDWETGRLEATGSVAEVPTPTCVAVR